ncbi:uncharacterized protein BDCG_06924 [Blastomyces dermatitidis ER-3]|uniref:Uncharacterized protein n=2 Tax=Blastomyces TaxID=229219 RepID=A0A179UZE2_BLAGS|nr:uncharacterized protein BDBG_07925 [Blastomyces gilchristii SLH14081]XP_045278268.1 uncharacterized protein BDCG_06924 [Blastomyces dermatitidis ER-3]EEQ91804.1 hypothetical protein BDCG_06924 [Blastomyces dermatitidis ER-3]EQL34841.1 hypothetical protein BDFG_03287 [Blastomyces dermatitidis ATCC 26199]OAT12599.1 hypothetical protein BDBG_07925 [Blastomyces gilchristii SLH14081]
MIPRTELLAILALTLLRTVQASPGSPITSDTRANQGDLSPIGPLRFRRDIQDATAPIVAIATDDSSGKVEIPEAIQVQWQDEDAKDNGYPILIRRNPLMPPKEPPFGQSSGKSCNSGTLGCQPTKFRMRARDNDFEEEGADRTVLAAAVPPPQLIPASPSINPSAGKEEDSILKTPLSRLQSGEKDTYPNPDWFPLKPEKRPPPPPVRAGPVNAFTDDPNAKDPSPGPKQGQLMFGLGPAVNVPPPPAPPEEGTVDKLLSRSGPVSRIMSLQYREKAADERNNKASQILDLKVTKSSDSPSEEVQDAADTIGGGISLTEPRHREYPSTPKLNQRSEADANPLPKRDTTMFIPPGPASRPKQGSPLRDSWEQRISLCGGVEQSFGKSATCVRWADRKPNRSL